MAAVPPRMGTANIHDQTSIERIYPADEFARNSSENDQSNIEVQHGVRVLSVPDGDGNFELQAATKHVGEAGGSVFLAPFRSAYPDLAAGYQSFVKDIITAAQGDAYDPATSPGQGDPRIRGARQ
ncbi:MAG: hypothetical protein JO001_06935 [Alphaproteobacteria bacterium]|nr:hypothetical protein [Alphaproteobacteria bacterium]